MTISAARIAKIIYMARSRKSIREDAKSVLEGIDLSAYDSIREKYRYILPEIKFRQHFNLLEKLIEQTRVVYSLGIRHASPLNILDIGTGIGAFPFLCNRFGHRAMGMDLGLSEYFNDQSEFLGLEVVRWKIASFESLPALGQRFDLITAFRICFNNHKTDQVWGPAEWDFFLRDLSEGHLEEKGRVHLHFNPENTGSCFTPELRDYFKRMGADVDSSTVRFPSMEAFRKDRVPADFDLSGYANPGNAQDPKVMHIPDLIRT